MLKICVFTATRAEYGLLRPLMYLLQDNQACQLQVLVSGTHLIPEFGMTCNEIIKDGFYIDEKVEMTMAADSASAMSKSMGLGLICFAEAIDRLAPDWCIVLGDRFESLSMAIACTNAGIPIAHIHGGEITVGAVDEAFRHSITKMSHLHLTSTNEYRNRVIQLGEQPDHVHNVGSLGVESIKSLKLLSRTELAEAIEFDLHNSFGLITFHPATIENDTAKSQFKELLLAISQILDGQARNDDKYLKYPQKFIFTKSNSDAGGRNINAMIEEFVSKSEVNLAMYSSLGQLKYLSSLSHCQLVIGNSSSGIIEAPSFKIPTINIGDRQKGRVRAKSVIDCRPDCQSILNAFETSISKSYQQLLNDCQNPYEGMETSKRILETIMSTNRSNILKKQFFDFN